MRFGHGRKTRNGENCISATAEAEKTPQKRFSNPLEMGKKPQNGFPIPWKWGKSFKNGFPTSWKQERQMFQLNSYE